jgi:hypothetical protein
MTMTPAELNGQDRPATGDHVRPDPDRGEAESMAQHLRYRARPIVECSGHSAFKAALSLNARWCQPRHASPTSSARRPPGPLLGVALGASKSRDEIIEVLRVHQIVHHAASCDGAAAVNLFLSRAVRARR